MAAVLGPAGPAGAHAERPSHFPEPPGRVPEYRTTGPALLVCKGRRTLDLIRTFPERLRDHNLDLYRDCRQHGFRHVQDAVDAVPRPGSRILILPGEYREKPYAGAPSGECADLA